MRVLDALASRGVMPEYAALRSEAGASVLRSTTPWFTVPAWITWMTGVSAERHGLISWVASSPRDHWERGERARRFVSLRDLEHPTIFRLLSDAGMRVASLNMPVTFPPEEVNGVMVSGFLAPVDPRRAAYPPGYLRRYPSYQIDVEEGPPEVSGKTGVVEDVRSSEEVVRYTRQLMEMARARHEVALDLLAEDFDLVSVVYVGTDRLSHVAWPDVQAVMERPPSTPAQQAVVDYYGQLDRLLGETRRADPSALLLVTSDHGQGPPPGRVIAPNAWLKGEGLISLRAPGARRASHLVTWPALRRRIWRVWRRIRGIPSGARPFVDWDSTSAYAITMPHCALFGVAVPDGGAARENVAAGLRQIVDPETGRRPVASVVNADDICRSERARERFPDLLVLLEPGYGMVGDLDGPVVRSGGIGVSGQHEPEGILLAEGDGVRQGEHAEAEIADVAPTILAAFGLGAPEHMDGRSVPWVATAADALQSATPERETAAAPDEGLSLDEEEQVAEHLRSLGYIE